MQRREFFQAGLAAGAGLAWAAAPVLSAENGPPAEAINVALVGAGSQGRVLGNALAAIGGVRVAAVCDIWKYRRTSALAYFKTYGHEAREYEDYREMLAQETDLRAVVVATPDFVHAEQAAACLKAGLHVYCEGMMAPTLDAAKGLVRAGRESGRLLQIGYQRRSSPRYRHVREKLLGEAELVGQVTHAAAQWCHPVSDDFGWPKRFVIPDETLAKYGYANMHEFRNWRWFRRYTAGPMAGFASHQLDVLGWFLGADPRAVTASGGTDYYPGRDCCDNVMASFEYPTPDGMVRASYQMLTTTSGGGAGANYEMLMGTEGSIKVSENPKWTRAYHEAYGPEWNPWVGKGYLVKAAGPVAEKPEDPNEVRVRETGLVVPYDIPVALDKPAHQLHLENFFEAIRGRAQLACPAEVALRAEAAALKALEAVAARRTIDLQPGDFVA